VRLREGQVVDMRSIELQKPLDRMIIRIIPIFQVIRMNYNTTKVELQEPVTQTIIVIRILLTSSNEEAVTKNQSHHPPPARNHKSVSSSSSSTEVAGKSAGIIYCQSVGNTPVSESKILCKRSSQLPSRVFAKLSNSWQQTKISQSRS